MNSYSFSLTILSLFTILGFSWEDYISVEGKFSISTPGSFIEKVNEVETRIGNLEYHTFYHQASDTADNLVYIVSYVDYPEEAVHSDSTELLDEFFEATVDSSVKSVKGNLFYASPIQYEGYPGRLWRVIYNDGEASIRTKAFLVRNRFYTIQTITLKDKSLNPSIDKFMDSFQLIE